MPQSLCTRVPVRPGHLEQVLSWVRKRDEADLKAALRERGVHAQVIVVDQSEQGHSLVWYVLCDDPKQATIGMLLSSHEVDVTGREVMDKWLDTDSATTLEVAAAVFA